MINLNGYVNTPEGVQKFNWPGWATKYDDLNHRIFEMKCLLLLSLQPINFPKEKSIKQELYTINIDLLIYKKSPSKKGFLILAKNN